MPLLSRCFLKSSVLCLALGMVLGGLILFQKGTGWFPTFWVFLPAHTYLVMIGGMSQFALGVSFWIFPRFGGSTSHGNMPLAWGSYGLLNTAIVLIALHPLIDILGGPAVAAWAFGLAGMLQSLASLAFVLHLWPRIRAGERRARK